MQRMDDPFTTQGWEHRTVWTAPPVRPPQWFAARSDTGPRKAAVLAGMVRSPAAGRTAPHALMQFTDVALEHLRRNGYDVMVVDPMDGGAQPDRPIHLIICELLAYDAVLPALVPQGRAVWLGTRPHWAVESRAVARRCAEVAAKRGFQPFVPPWELGEGNRGADSASAVLACDGGSYQGRADLVDEVGNSYLRNLALLPLPDRRGRGFAWIGTGSLVRKGMDLTLEVFAQLPELRVHLMAPLHWADQRAFVWHFREELFHLDNVVPVGYVLPGSPAWREMLEHNSFVLLPSCAEGRAGALLDGMVNGLIPIATRACGVAIEQCGGITIEDTTTGALRTAVETAAALPEAELRDRSAAARAYALKEHSTQRLADRVRRSLTGLIR
ncbi:glycosyltransferase [Streptacidiphilus sp. P02-A3a]|uniref:glycosyltransferase n=1 Tax=Streptacidiphilus sp. P02-A3a TaxID=2704468 RepID=UPI0015FB2DB1|nr:glycosyltransferase [Streptacidiphilus sp. P02-A3a]QMU69790.1 glycosyltransferase [Streptacidiphilus sp. P02-A3a]